MSAERNPEFLGNDDPLSIYDYPLGEMPAVPIGQVSHVELSINEDGTVNVSKKTDAEIQEVRDVASEVGAEVIDTTNGEHKSTVVKHKGWIWVGRAIGVAMGVTAIGATTAFAIEHHRRKSRRSSP